MDCAFADDASGPEDRFEEYDSTATVDANKDGKLSADEFDQKVDFLALDELRQQRLRPVVAKTFPLEKAADAHRFQLFDLLADPLELKDVLARNRPLEERPASLEARLEETQVGRFVDHRESVNVFPVRVDVGDDVGHIGEVLLRVDAAGECEPDELEPVRNMIGANMSLRRSVTPLS